MSAYQIKKDVDIPKKLDVNIPQNKDLDIHSKNNNQSSVVHFYHSTPLTRTNQPQLHTIDDDFLIPDATKDEVRLARLQVIVLPLLLDPTFHSSPNLRYTFFKSTNTDVLPILNTV